MPHHAVFRCDAAPSIGAGHLVRCLTLADALADRGWTCRFFSLPGSGAAVARFAGVAHEMIESEAADDPAALRALAPQGCDLFVLDSYRLGIEYEMALGSWSALSLVLDDRPLRRHAAGVLLDPTFGRTPSQYAPLVPEGTLLLLGPDYALLRRAFSAARPKALACRAGKGTVAKILLAFGGSAERQALEFALEGCRRAGVAGEIHVVAPEHWRLPARTGALQLVVHGLTADMHRLMTACDLAVGAGGGSAWERCCLGLPTLMVRVADNQTDVARALSEAGAAVDLGAVSFITPGMVARNLRDLAEDASRRKEMSARAALICDGLGARRVAGVLSPWFARDGEPVTLRPATMADARLMFQWQQIPAVRRHTPNPEPPSWDTHLSWLGRRLADAAAGPFTIIVKGKKDVGALRLDNLGPKSREEDLEADALCVSIYLEPGAHGRGVGTAALQAARFLVAHSPFYAEVLPGNEASHRLFRRAGYHEVSPSLYRHPPRASSRPVEMNLRVAQRTCSELRAAQDEQAP